MESTSNIFMVKIENVSFGCSSIFEIWISDGSGPVTGGPSDSQIMPPGGECFAPYCFWNFSLYKLYLGKRLSISFQYVCVLMLSSSLRCCDC